MRHGRAGLPVERLFLAAFFECNGGVVVVNVSSTRTKYRISCGNEELDNLLGEGRIMNLKKVSKQNGRFIKSSPKMRFGWFLNGFRPLS